MKVCSSGAGREKTRIRRNNQFHTIMHTIELISHAGNALLRVSQKSWYADKSDFFIFLGPLTTNMDYAAKRCKLQVKLCIDGFIIRDMNMLMRST